MPGPPTAVASPTWHPHKGMKVLTIAPWGSDNDLQNGYLIYGAGEEVLVKYVGHDASRDEIGWLYGESLVSNRQGWFRRQEVRPDFPPAAAVVSARHVPSRHEGISKFVAFLLRNTAGAARHGISIDAHGFVPLTHVQRVVRHQRALSEVLSEGNCHRDGTPRFECCQFVNGEWHVRSTRHRRHVDNRVIPWQTGGAVASQPNLTAMMRVVSAPIPASQPVMAQGGESAGRSMERAESMEQSLVAVVPAASSHETSLVVLPGGRAGQHEKCFYCNAAAAKRFICPTCVGPRNDTPLGQGCYMLCEKCLFEKACRYCGRPATPADAVTDSDLANESRSGVSDSIPLGGNFEDYTTSPYLYQWLLNMPVPLGPFDNPNIADMENTFAARVARRIGRCTRVWRFRKHRSGGPSPCSATVWFLQLPAGYRPPPDEHTLNSVSLLTIASPDCKTFKEAVTEALRSVDEEDAT
eukprot:gnl/TRDRNA2_/TRDRNA2_81090_c0_seq1.p1 gnl/TRDRNA2_/TRDRNA2_81090_c0~~gnl/TRDRNA2_/TRDRNA2_81090_c0_seq1.p1  ORF type:complete len:486 (+),score=43.37 gnl/TRDRNA2_/TRDRNA2_81090_c0_seq1:58-1458(+)